MPKPRKKSPTSTDDECSNDKGSSEEYEHFVADEEVFDPWAGEVDGAGASKTRLLPRHLLQKIERATAARKSLSRSKVE